VCTFLHDTQRVKIPTVPDADHCRVVVPVFPACETRVQLARQVQIRIEAETEQPAMKVTMNRTEYNRNRKFRPCSGCCERCFDLDLLRYGLESSQPLSTVVDGPDDYKAAEMIAVAWVNEGKKGVRIGFEVVYDLEEEEKDLLRKILIM
jgi:hypothetical protein